MREWGIGMAINAWLPTLKQLSELPGPAGREGPVRDWLRQRWKRHVEEWEEDSLGNILCKVGGQGPRVLIAAHMDEIGFIVRYITDSGFILVESAQEPRDVPLDKLYMIGCRAQVIGRGGVVAEGIFAAPAGHVLSQSFVNRTLTYKDFFVDIGANSRKEAEKKGVHIGARVVWYRPLLQMGTRVIGKAMDDRALLGVMDLLLKQLIQRKESLAYEVWFGATVQEENKAHGAYAIGRKREFDLAIPLDVGLVGDIPNISEDDYPARLGGGPILVHRDSVVHYDEGLLWKMADVAEQHHIPYQHGLFSNYGSDGIAFVDSGIRSILVTIPTRYTHTPFEMIELSDIGHTVELLSCFLQQKR
ncbi:M42 family peptidase [Thermoactinomyces sp. CICC 10523]|nr:M42 family peptidase [Thermoactinomyces sp. CICC 10523]